MRNRLQFETLHAHTVASDGELTHEEILDMCKKNGIGIVAFTDHDTLMSPPLFDKLRNNNHDVTFISGIEMSANYVKEVEGKIILFHIVGLFVDPTDKTLLDYCDTAKTKRRERAASMIRNLSSIGFHITMDEINAFAGGDVIGRPHIVKALLAKEENKKIVENLEKKLTQEALHDESLRKKYEEVKSHTLWQKVFDLVLSDTAFIKGIYLHYGEKVSMDDAVKLIRDAGGISILAHWTYYKQKVGAELVETFCKERRIDGLETVYGLDANSREIEEFTGDMNYLAGLAQHYNLAEGGGGDFHKASDFELIHKPPIKDLMSRTIGFTGNILKKYPTLDVTFSTVRK